MDLSILIPVYNWDISLLLARILHEVEDFSLAGRVEIILMDDCSTDAVLCGKNDGFIAEHPQPCLKYLKLRHNAGRAAIRNLLASEASGNFLLFLDCDVLPDTADFIRSYLAHAMENSFDVVCGGISYRTRIMNNPKFDYHVYLGNKKEVQAAAVRNKTPWRFILTSNIMVRKSVFQETSFDERFTGYGYEDIEWGVRLAEKHRVLHIDNTASHLGLVTKARTYEKMRNSVPNYMLLGELCPAAFSASVISGFARILSHCGDSILRLLDHSLKRLFLRSRFGERFAFILFQLNFAVLLALALKEKSRQLKHV